VIPAVAQFLSFPLRDCDPLKSQSLIDKAVSMRKKCERKSFITMNDWIFLSISLILMTILFLSEIRTKPESTENHCLSRCRNRKSQSKKKTSSKTKQQKDSVHHKSLDKEPQCHESDPLLELHSSAETAQPSIDTVQQSDEMAQETGEAVQLVGGMAQQTGGAVQLIGGTAQQSDNTVQQSVDTVQQSVDTVQPSDNTVQQSVDTAQSSDNTVQQSVDTAQQLGEMTQQTGNKVQQFSQTIQPSRVIPYTASKPLSGI
jgi:methyl-accepting chemotaxis protein